MWEYIARVRPHTELIANQPPGVAASHQALTPRVKAVSLRAGLVKPPV